MEKYIKYFVKINLLHARKASKNLIKELIKTKVRIYLVELKLILMTCQFCVLESRFINILTITIK